MSTDSVVGVGGEKPGVYVSQPKPTWPKLLFAVSYCVLAFFCNLFVLVLNHDRTARERLPDLVFEFIPQQYWGFQLADTCTFMMNISIFLVIFLHKYRKILLIRTAYLIGTLFYFRAIMQALNSLPNAVGENSCKPPIRNITASQVFERFGSYFSKFASLTSKDILCGDMMFSGHTTTQMLGLHINIFYLPRSLWPYKILLTLITTFGIFGLIVSRSHYAIDIVVGYIFAKGIFIVYHGFCEVPLEIRYHKHGCVYNRLWIAPLMFWFEDGLSPGLISGYIKERNLFEGNNGNNYPPKEISWFLPWPKCLVNHFEVWNTKDENAICGRISKSLNKCVLAKLFD